MNSKKQYINVMWNTVGSIFYSFCQWLMTVVVVYISTYEDAGFLSIAMTMSSSFSAIALFSMRNYQISDVNGEYSVHEYVGSRFLTNIIALVTCTVFSLMKNTVYMSACVCAFMVIRIAEAFADVLHGQDQKYDRYDYIGISYMIRGLLSIVAYVSILKLTGSLLITLVIVAALNLISVFLWDYRVTNRLENILPVISLRVFRLLKICAPIVVFSFLLSVHNLYPKTVLSKMLGNEQLGIYSTIATPTLVIQVFAMVAFNPFLPDISRKYQCGDMKDFREIFRKLLLVFSAVIVVCYIMSALLGKIALRILFGQKILEHYDLFIPIITVTILTGIIWVLSAIIIGMRKNAFLISIILVSMLVNVIITKWCISTFGMNGASIAQIIPYSFLVIAMIVRIILSTGCKDKKEAR
ncbi:Membrane protein involved in the export of O-antigen and teichoic acid [Butyrivibrio proteoclasticus]|uniref:Membrane protein involved in the export of O-antigen and teichoic acid n=1 Tax=Butyrivibrio proteoclasticus TaxID=43305 RepID=A0A1I5PUJ7_9FIRM|nr:hypothetical protein [Butyrivibrio proteoclasticus]SFP37702.1 Membrane protein involved in the export of O-antigen and teichoic acid [Butyrivibrio proteoclasticus]